MMAVEQGLEREVVEFAERWVGRWNAHDVDGILALVTEDVVWEDPSIDGTAGTYSAAIAACGRWSPTTTRWSSCAA
jgi:ketosteroid isomerase-like protein